MIKVGDVVYVLGNLAVVTAIGGVTNSETGQETKLYNCIKPDGNVFFCTDRIEIVKTDVSCSPELQDFLYGIRKGETKW